MDSPSLLSRESITLFRMSAERAAHAYVGVDFSCSVSKCLSSRHFRPSRTASSTPIGATKRSVSEPDQDSGPGRRGQVDPEQLLVKMTTDATCMPPPIPGICTILPNATKPLKTAPSIIEKFAVWGKERNRHHVASTITIHSATLYARICRVKEPLRVDRMPPAKATSTSSIQSDISRV